MSSTTSRLGRSPDLAGRKRKAALTTAWRVCSSLGARVLALRAGVTPAVFYALVDPACAHQPSSASLRAVSVTLGDFASRLAAESARLERVAAETGAAGD